MRLISRASRQLVGASKAIAFDAFDYFAPCSLTIQGFYLHHWIRESVSRGPVQRVHDPLGRGFSTGGAQAKSGALSSGFWHLKTLKRINKYIEKRMYLVLQHVFYCLIVAQHQNNV